jgi:leader peptidase (prepilin peptidase)/N-methyltransferase
MIWGAAAGLAAALPVGGLAHRLQHTTAPWPLRRWIAVAIGCAAAGSAATTIRPITAAVVYAAVLATIVAASAVDATEQRLPDVLTLAAGFGGLAALTTITLTTGTGNALRALAGAAIFGGWILLGAMAVRDGYGLGDVKLGAALGVTLGWHSWAALAAGILLTQIAVTITLVAARTRGAQYAALGPAFAVAAITALYFS